MLQFLMMGPQEYKFVNKLFGDLMMCTSSTAPDPGNFQSAEI
jgi:hypothetical protein